MRPYSFAPTAALIGKVLLGSSSLALASGLISISGAKAAGWTANPSATGYLCNLTDSACFNPASPVNSPLVGDKILTLLGASGVNTDVAEFTQDPGDPNTPWHLTLDFNPNRNAPSTGNLDYKITINNLSNWFEQVKLGNDSTITNGLYTLTKKLYTDATFSTLLINAPLLNPPSPQGINIANLKLQTLFVRDEWNISPGANGSLNNIQNSYSQTNDVPGPAPLLGLGAMVGLSRRLRRRIKGA